MACFVRADSNDPVAFLKQTHHGFSGFSYNPRHFVHCDMAIHFYGLDDFVFVRLLYRDIYRDILFFEPASVKRNRNGYRGGSKIIRFSSVFSDDLRYPVSRLLDGVASRFFCVRL